MIKYEENLAARLNGNNLQPLAGASVTVTDMVTNLPAALYQDDELTPIPQPLITDNNGYFSFRAADGRYKLTFASGANSSRFDTFTREVVLEDPADNPFLTAQELALQNGAAKIGYGTRTVSDKLGEVVSVKDFGAKGDGVTDDTAAIQAAIVACAGKQLHMPHGAYLCGELDLSGIGIKISRDAGAEFIMTGPRLISCNNDHTSILNIASITSGVLTVEGSAVTTVSILNFAAPPTGYTKGDVVKVVSDDVDANSDDALNFLGEFGTVAAVIDSAVYLNGLLEDTYTTNARVGKVAPHRIDLDIVATNNNAATGSLIQIEGCYKPIIKVQIKRHPGIGINSIGNYYAQFIDCTGELLRNANGFLGYLINDVSGLGTQIIRPKGRLCRHVTTTGFNTVTVGVSQLTRYGATRDHTVIDGKCEGAEGSAWDSHAGSRRSKWINCTVRGVVQGYSAAPSAFQIRGIDEEIINGESSPNVPVFVSILNTARRAVITNPRSFSPNFIRSSTPGVPDALAIQAGFAFSKNGGYVVSSVGRDVLVNGTRITHNVAGSNRQCFDLSSCTVRFINADIQVTGTGAETGYRIVRGNTGTVNAVGKVSFSHTLLGAVPSILRQEGDCILGGRMVVDTAFALNNASGTPSGTWSYLTRRTDTGTVSTSVADFTDYLAKLATL